MISPLYVEGTNVHLVSPINKLLSFVELFHDLLISSYAFISMTMREVLDVPMKHNPLKAVARQSYCILIVTAVGWPSGGVAAW